MKALGVRAAWFAILAAGAAAASAQEAAPPAEPAAVPPPPPELPMPAAPDAAAETMAENAAPAGPDAAPPMTTAPTLRSARRSLSFRRYNQLTVRSDDAEQFYYIRQDNYRALGATDDERLRKLQDLPSFGPNPVGGAYSVYLGENYLFLPVCNGRLDRAKGRLNRLTAAGGSVTIACR